MHKVKLTQETLVSAAGSRARQGGAKKVQDVFCHKLEMSYMESEFPFLLLGYGLASVRPDSSFLDIP